MLEPYEPTAEVGKDKLKYNYLFPNKVLKLKFLYFLNFRVTFMLYY